MSNIAQRIDITKTPFSRYGSWISVTTVSHTSPLRITNVHQMFGEDQALMLDFTHGGEPVYFSIQASPAAITVTSDFGSARLYMKGDDGLVVESEGLDLEFLALDSEGERRKPGPLSQIVYKDSGSGAAGRKVIDIRRGDLATFDVIRGKLDAGVSALRYPATGDGKTVVLLRIGKSVPDGTPTVDVEADISDSAEQWNAFLAKMPPVPPDRRKEAEAAWHVVWCSFVRAEGCLPYDAMLVNKDFMNGVWSWDHCFHALAVARGDFRAGLEQFLLPFALQNEQGKLPDVWRAPDVVFWGITKPPVHGWCLLKLMELGDIELPMLEKIYSYLVNWTGFWFAERDEDGDGVPNYTEDGCDSGMDNATVFDVKARLETPDLSAYLVLQMKTLAVLDRKLGREDDAKAWEARAEKLLLDLYDHCWKGDRFVCVTNGTHDYDPEPTALLPLMPIVLGELLDKDKFDKTVALLESKFMTAYGVASEDPKSKKYEVDSYWRGPIWASSTHLIVDGLRRGGREDLAREIARRYCDMVKYAAGGNYENHDALNGTGLRSTGFSWTSAVNLVFMWEYLM